MLAYAILGASAALILLAAYYVKKVSDRRKKG